VAVTVEQQVLGVKVRTGAAGTGEIAYRAFGSEDVDEVLAELETTAPSTLAGLDLVGFDIGLAAQAEDGVYDAVALYGAREASEFIPTGQRRVNFDTGGTTERLTKSITTVSRTPSGAADYKGAIGVSDTGVEGVDIIVPSFRFSITKAFALSAVDAAYQLAVMNLTGKVNNATFEGWAAGTVLFTGASGAQNPGKDYELTFNFQVSPAQTNIPFVDSVVIPAKGGHEYLWVKYEPEEDATAKALAQRPVAAYVEKVYDTGDFSVLNAGA